MFQAGYFKNNDFHFFMPRRHHPFLIVIDESPPLLALDWLSRHIMRRVLLSLDGLTFNHSFPKDIEALKRGNISRLQSLRKPMKLYQTDQNITNSYRSLTLSLICEQTRTGFTRING